MGSQDSYFSNREQNSIREESHQSSPSRFQDSFCNIEELGLGGFGVVFKAKNILDQKEYAVKRIPIDPSIRDKVIREVRIFAQLDHEYITRYNTAWTEKMSVILQDNASSSEEAGNKDITTECSWVSFQKPEGMDVDKSSSLGMDVDKSSDPSMDVDQKFDYNSNFKRVSKADRASLRKKRKLETTEYLYVQMELCESTNLKKWLEDNEIRNKEEITCMFQQITEAVKYMHAQNVAHRDLKPANILFGKNKTMKVGDFGLAKIMSDPTDGQKQKHSHVGSELYISPEQLERKGDYGLPVDIYAMGVILLELLVYFKTRQELAKTLIDLKEGISQNHFSSKFPKEIELVVRMLSRDPANRPTAEEILRTLKEIKINNALTIEDDEQREAILRSALEQ